jgi:succinate dehydrogenase/fumarate reductase flavoprotein subunit
MARKEYRKDARNQGVRQRAAGRSVGGRSAERRKGEIPFLKFPEWNAEADVVIIGYGAAGANAAIAAHDAGAEALVLEKMPTPGGNSGVSAGAMVIPENLADALEYYRALSFGTADEELTRGFAEAMVGIPELLTRLGAEFGILRKEPPYFPALLDCNVRRIQFNPTGLKGFEFLSNLVEKRKIRIMFRSPAKALIQNPETKEVLGVEGEAEGKKIHIRAKKGVILACGGYEYNREMLGSFNFPGLSDFIYPWGNPGNTGDGIRMALEAGAALWHTASIEWGALCARAPSREFGMAIGLGVGRAMPEGSFIFVNKYGKRFMKEDKNLIHRKDSLEILYFDHERAEYRNLPAYVIFDENYRRRGPIACTLKFFEGLWGGPVGYPMIHKVYEWSDDNSSEIEKGWIIKADTIHELATKIRVDEQSLEETLAKFESYSTDGKDSDFGRPGNSLAPVKIPPFYALELALSLVNTQGGPKHDRQCRVLDFDNKPIPRLYAAGELGSFFGFLYQGGNNYPEAWAFGEIAGREAAAEKPLK